MLSAMKKNNNETDTSFREITIIPGETDYPFDTSIVEDSSVSSDYNIETINNIAHDILGKFDDFLIYSQEDDSALGKILREQLETFFISTKYKLLFKSQISFIDWEFSRFELYHIPIGMSNNVAKNLWDNEADECWNDV